MPTTTAGRSERRSFQTGRTRLRAGYACLAAGTLAVLGACASTPAALVVDNLDPSTGTTVTVLTEPVEMVSERGRGTLDPFAYVAPFEIDRMGKRGLYVWISTPEDAGKARQVQLLCDAQPLTLGTVALQLADVGLSRAPYARPAPWSGAWYFALPEPALECLASAHSVAAVAQMPDGSELRFDARTDRLHSLTGFAERHAKPL